MKQFFITKFSVTLLQAPLAQSFRTALGDHDAMENVLFSLTLNDGTRGQGEAAIASHITGETVNATVQNLNLAGRSLVGKPAGDYLRLSAQLHERFPNNTSAIAAVETALLDALTRQWGIALWKFFGDRPRPLTTDVTIVIADLAETEMAVRKFYRQGFRTFKVKIGRDMDLDLKRVLAVRRLAPRSTLYLDANQGYSAPQILKFMKSIKRYGVTVALLEQPVPKKDWEGLKRVSRLAGVPVCADESVSSLSDAARAVREKAVPVINIKLMKTGIFQSREIALLAKANGIKLMIGGMMESSLAMTTSAHLAAGLGCFDHVDLDTPFFIKKGFDRNPFLSSRGVYDLRRVKAGIGIRIS